MTQNRFHAYLIDYAGYHKTHGNKMTHQVGIPMIVIAIAGLLAKVELGPTFANGLLAIDLGLIVGLLIAAWYIAMDWRIGVPSSLAMLAMYLIGRPIPWPWLVGMFVVGWIVQFVGHIKYEHNRPAFFKNFEHLLIGPVWVFGAWFRYLPNLETPSAAASPMR